LTDVLLYHVVDGAVMAETVVTLESATTLGGEDVTITVTDGNVFLNETTQVIITDIEASNGVIHVIDTVLLPPSMSAEAEMAPSIAEIAVADGRFTTLVAALDAAGLVETLSGEGSFTVFAPTDDAFAALPEGTVASLLEDPAGALTDILLYHVVDGAVMAETVVTLESATTLQGEDVTITVTDGNVFLNDTIQVIITDIEASNGIIHVIDGVLLPPSMTAEELPSIAEIAVEDGRFTTLVAALEAAGLVETLSGEGAFTVFAPTDDAFAALPEGTVATLLEDPAGALTDILLYHVVDGVVPAEMVVTLESATTLNGADVTITVNDAGEVFLNDTIQVIITDIQASNGIIHVIDGVLLP
jgi:transforming growth factor-beta-induced protein